MALLRWFEREGGRLGGLTPTSISGTIRADGACWLKMQVFADAGMATVLAESPAVELVADNNYTGTVTVDGLAPNQRYWYHFRLEDVPYTDYRNGSAETYSAGSFDTPPAIEGISKEYKISFMTCNGVHAAPEKHNYGDIWRAWFRLNQLGIQQNFMLGDMYYSDTDSGNALPYYSEGAWRNTSEGDSSLEAYRTAFIGTVDVLRYHGYQNYMADFFLNTPSAWMWDDHDRGWNNMDGSHTWTAEETLRAARAQKVACENYMDMNGIYITQDGRSYTPQVNEVNYYHVDIGITRIIVPDLRSFRDDRNDEDLPTKTMMGATQKAWFKAKVQEWNQPGRNLIIGSQMMFDGMINYDGNGSTDHYAMWSHERDEIMQFLFDNFDTKRMFIYSGDTHLGCVAVFDEDYNGGDGREIYQVTAATLWERNYRDFLNTWKVGVSGKGGRYLKQRIDEPVMCTVDLHTDGRMTVKMVELYTGKIPWQRTFGE